MTFDEALIQVDKMTLKELLNKFKVYGINDFDKHDAKDIIFLVLLPVDSITYDPTDDPECWILLKESLNTDCEIGNSIELFDPESNIVGSYRVLKIGLFSDTSSTPLTKKQKHILNETRELERNLKKRLLSGDSYSNDIADLLTIIQAAIMDIESGERYRIKGAIELLNILKSGDAKKLERYFKKYNLGREEQHDTTFSYQ